MAVFSAAISISVSKFTDPERSKNFVSAMTSNVFVFREVTSKKDVQNPELSDETRLGFQTSNECSLKRIRKSRISCDFWRSHLLNMIGFRLDTRTN